MAESSAGLLHGGADQESDWVVLPRRARQVLDDEFHARGSTVVIVAGLLLRTIGAMLQGIGNILESYVVERLISEGPPANASMPATYQPLPAAPEPLQDQDEGEEDDHQCLMQRQGRQMSDITDGKPKG